MRRSIAVLLAGGIALAISSAAAAPIQVCGWNDWYGGVPWGLVATAYYARDFPGADFDFAVLNSGDDLRGVVQKYLSDGGNCDALTLLGYSPYCLAVSPLVPSNVAWVDGVATSTDLSNKLYNPAFNRVVPTDAVGAAGTAILAADRGWKQLSILSVDDSYGKSISQGFSDRYAMLGGKIEFNRFVPADCAVSVIIAAINTILSASQSRVLFMAGSYGEPGIQAIQQSLAATGTIVLFTESMCSDNYLSRVPGAWCATYGMNATAAAQLQVAYSNRDVAAETARYGAVLDYAAGDTSYAIDIFAGLVIDATRAAMAGAYGWARANQTQYPAAADFIRTISFQGLTGSVSFDANGDRVEAALDVFNSQPTAANASVVALVNVGSMYGGLVHYADTKAAKYYAVGGFSTNAPSGLKPLAAGSTQFPAWAIAIIVVVVVLVAVTAAVAMQARGKQRNNSCAPKDAATPFAVMFTDIQSSTSQWATNPEVMGGAVDLHHDIIRTVLAKYDGYEVKTIGDSFMVAFEDTAKALQCAIQIQTALFNATWPPEIDAVYRKSSPAPVANYGDMWNGLRVRIGLHYGIGSVKFDDVTLGYDYYGTVVNTAARVESVGNGGQILLTKAAFDEALSRLPNFKSMATATELGPQPLRGLHAPVELVQITPFEFSARTFGPLRLDVDDAPAVEGCDAESTATGPQGSRSGSTAGSRYGDSAEQILHRGAKASHTQLAKLLEQHALMKALFSVVPTKDRPKVVGDFASRWRLSAGKLSTAGSVDRCLARLSIKVAAVAAAAATSESVGATPQPQSLFISDSNVTGGDDLPGSTQH